MRWLHDRILIKPVSPEKVRGGLMLPDHEQDKSMTGEVIGVGHGVPLHNIHLNITGEISNEGLEKLREIVELIENGRALKVKPGDMVLYGRYAGTTIMLNDEEHLLIREADVFGII